MKWIRKIWARSAGYFWLPCPVCGEMFGGFEIGNGHVTDQDGKKFCCCKNCDFEAGQVETLNGNTMLITPGAAKLVRHNTAS